MSVQFTREDGQGRQSMVVTFSGKRESARRSREQATDLNQPGIWGRWERRCRRRILSSPIWAAGVKPLYDSHGAGSGTDNPVCMDTVLDSVRLSAGLAAMAALVHDVLIVFAVFLVFSIPLNDAFVAVVLTIIGYSINDTIVIYDRISGKYEKGEGRKYTG